MKIEKTLSVQKAPKKSIKLLSYLRKGPNEENFVKTELEAITDEFHKAVPKEANESGSEVEIVEGSFSTLKPINFPRVVPSTSAESTVPKNKCAVRIENIKKPENSKESENDSTSENEQDIRAVSHASKIYLEEADIFINKSEKFVKHTYLQRQKLTKRLNKYERKTKRIQKTLEDLDKALALGKYYLKNKV